MSFIDDIFTIFCKGHKNAEEIASVCSKYVTGNSDKDIVFLFDGYDECPKEQQQSGLICDILNRDVIPCCGLIVTSRPHASVSLRNEATVRVEILGFTKCEQDNYIKTSMCEEQKIDKLSQYLQSHPIINSLCFIPFNMVVLLHRNSTS